MDALSHALIAYVLFSYPSLAALVPFAVLGAVIPDADIFFPRISDETPSLYIFTHGGITHSIVGAAVLSVLSYSVVVVLGTIGWVPKTALAAGPFGFAAVLAGALLHLAIDVPAMPGIPLLAPFSDRKYTLGVLPGPSLLLALAAVAVAILTILQAIAFATAVLVYAGIAVVYVGVRIAFFLWADVRLSGRKVPMINPFTWLVIHEDEGGYRILRHSLLHGAGPVTAFARYRDTSAPEVAGALSQAEVRRFLYHSYSVCAERVGSVLILSDPVREGGFLWYPPRFRRVAVAAP